MRRRGVITIAAAAILCAGCAGQATISSATRPGHATSAAGHASTAAAHAGQPSAHHAHPQAVEPVAGAGTGATAQPVSDTAGVSVATPAESRSLPRPQSNATIRAELAQSGMSASTTQATLTPSGLAVAPVGAPAAVQEVIAAGNEIARLPYRYGGGHETYQDTAYDCSGSISYAFAAAHLLDRTVVSGQLASWGDPGRGRWITVFANAGHTFMYVAGLRFDTVALAETGSRWSNRAADEPNLQTFAVRHPPGL